MARGSFDPKESGYIEVKDRIEKFYEKFPDGSIQSEIVEFGTDIVIVKAYAYRTPDDPRPGVGHSQMPIPGLTSFTKNSEVENAETSAWGRAIAALGFEVKKSIASAEEVENKMGPTPTTAAATSAVEDAATPAQKRKLMAEGRRLLGDDEQVRKFVFNTTGKNRSGILTKDDMTKLFDELEKVAAVGAALDEMEEKEDE